MKTIAILPAAVAVALLSAFGLQPSASLHAATTTNPPFVGRIQATLTRGAETQTFFYTVSTNRLRVERRETDRPYAVNVLELASGELTLLFPHNRSFVRLKPAAESGPPPMPAMPPLPAGPSGAVSPPGTGIGPGALPPGIGPTNLPGVAAPPPMRSLSQMPPGGLPPGIGPQAGGASGVGALPAMPMMPMELMEKPKLKATGQKTNLLGYTCEKFTLQQRGEVMEIWATDKRLPFQPWLANQPSRFGPRVIEEQWGALLTAKKLFPLLAILKLEDGPERLRFEVKSIKAEKIEDRDGTLFQPPPDYHEIEPLPF
jgi:hypothetical protein